MKYFIFGGAFNGKYDRIISLGYKSSDIFDCKVENIANIGDKKCVYNIQNLLLNDMFSVENVLEKLKNAEIVVCDDVSSGIVPLNKQDRIYRDNVGKLCCILTEKAEIVERVYFGIPMVIKC